MIAAIIPTLNEEQAIEDVLKGFPESYRGHEVRKYVVDGGSSDDTVRIAGENGAEIIEQRLGGGKGNGLRQALNEIDADYYVMIDGDATYDPGEFQKVVDPVLDGDAGHVIGWRRKREKDAIPFFNRIGNRAFNALTRLSTGKQVHDMLSGYRAFTRESLDYTSFTRPGFGIETEMTITALENEVKVKEVPISYNERKGESKLHPLRDGWRIFETLVRVVRDLNPLRFFFTLSLITLLLGVYPAYLTVREKLVTGFVQHLGPPIASGILLVVAIQFLIFGLMADQMKNVERRLKHQVK